VQTPLADVMDRALQLFEEKDFKLYAPAFYLDHESAAAIRRTQTRGLILQGRTVDEFYYPTGRAAPVDPMYNLRTE
jgi:hypothetical protein